MSETSLQRVAEAYSKNAGLQFVERVGEGAYKETFRVFNGKDSFALKVSKSGAQTERSKRELQALKMCNHRAIAKLLSMTEFPFDKQRYLVQLEEFCAGGTLQSRGTLTAVECVRVAIELSDALGHTANLRLVHRDIKPENLMYRSPESGLPVIVDFGLVRNLNDTSITPSWQDRGPGTPYYAPPEQLNNEKSLIDWRSDQFSLGVTLSALTLGLHPYVHDGEDPWATVTSVMNRKPLAEKFRNQAERSGLMPLLRMVAGWPFQRYRTPESLLTAWEALK